MRVVRRVVALGLLSLAVAISSITEAAPVIPTGDARLVDSSGAIDTRQASRTSCFGFVFRKRSGAYGFGHVAWGFAGARGGVAWGSVDGWQRTSADKAYFVVESDRESAMIDDMRRRDFDDYLVKSLPTRDCDYEAAIRESMSSTEGWYLPAAENCADATKAVLRALGFGGAALGDLFWTPAPNDWFWDLQANHGWSYRNFR